MRLIITTAAIASVGGVILYNFFLKGREKSSGKGKRIIVASTSELKVNAAMKAANASVRNVFNVKRTFFFSRNCHYIPLRKRTFFFRNDIITHQSQIAKGFKAKSSVSEQPVGFDETYRGAYNRLQCILQSKPNRQYDLAVSIENGIFFNETEDTCIDLAVVIVYDFATNKQTVATSAGVCFDRQCFAEWANKKSQRKNITVGSLISKKTGCSSRDPHSHITRHKFSRADLLEHSIRVALSQL